MPLPRGRCLGDDVVVVEFSDGRRVPAEGHVLDRWGDGSVRWLLVSFLASLSEASSERADVIVGPADAATASGPKVQVEQDGTTIRVDVGACRFEFAPGNGWPLRLVDGVQAAAAIDWAQSGLDLTLHDGTRADVVADRVGIVRAGALRAVISARGQAPLPGGRRLEVDWEFELHAGRPEAVVRVTLRNPHRAAHPGGFWELGDAGSTLIREASVVLRTRPAMPCEAARCSDTPTQPATGVPLPFSVYQDSSGGENWQGSNHVNREGRVPTRFCGYRRSDVGGEAGRRATPLVEFETSAGVVTLATRHFWQNFPKAVDVAAEGLRYGLFPAQWDDLHELQGGEQKTHDFALGFGAPVEPADGVSWWRERLEVSLDPEWVAATGVVPYLTPRADDPHREYVALVDAAIEGDDTFEKKREVVDEYGWRHFGDIYGDHETKFPIGFTGTGPLVSHYNNQYDPVAGFCYQWLRSGDTRWWHAFTELASHVVDIDIYHTDEDKAAYNRGLFWHTVHYIDAGKATHRTYPRAQGSHGGGPASEQNYATGLMLHYFLTGSTTSRDAAIGLAQFVVDMDDGSRTVFRWLAGGATGLATAAGANYYGPGRGSGNSVIALVDGHRLTGDHRFLLKADALIRRTAHPEQDIEALTLLDAETRWFYTMFLQALGRYLDHKAEIGECDDAYAYARETLLHFARWMATHERPILDAPERLYYPTETWAAQDMRKCEVFQYAALHATGEERQRFLERARYFFDYAVGTLTGMPTRTLCRPVVVLLSFGWSRAWFAKHPDAARPSPAASAGRWPPLRPFVPQKQVAIRRAKVVAALGGSAAFAAMAGLLLWIF